MGCSSKVDKFYRLFLAPGVGHCALGKSPIPTDSLAALAEWVESGVAPAFLDAATVDDADEVVTCRLCKWPTKPKYTGLRDPRDKSSWNCVDHAEGSGDLWYAVNRSLADSSITCLHSFFLELLGNPINSSMQEL
jgi:hypothetical protein